MNFDIDPKMGKLARDKVTGFEGVIIGVAHYLFGCTQYGLSPKMQQGAGIQTAEWLDAGRVEVIGEGIKPSEVQTTIPGGPNKDAPQAR